MTERIRSVEKKQGTRSQWWQRLEWVRRHENQDVILVALLSCFLGSLVVQRYHWGLAHIIVTLRGPRVQSWMVDAQKYDPQVGQLIRLPQLLTPDGTIQLPDKSGLTTLFFVGNCRACIARDNFTAVRTFAERLPRMNTYLVVSAGDASLMRDLWRSYGLRTPLLLDVSGIAAQYLNSFFDFRCYVLDQRSRILYLSKPERRLEQVENDVAAIAERERKEAKR